MIVLYSNHCPACDILKSKLDAKHINYTVVDDESILLEKGFDLMPVLEVEGKQMLLGEANKFVEAYREATTDEY